MIKHFCDVCGMEITHANIMAVATGGDVFLKTTIKRPSALSHDLQIKVSVTSQGEDTDE